MVKIKYKRSRLILYLVQGIAWLALFISGLFADALDWWQWTYLLFAAGMFWVYFDHRRNQYLIIENCELRIRVPFAGYLKVTDIQRVSWLNGEIRLITHSRKEFYIDADSISDENKQVLKEALGDLLL